VTESTATCDAVNECELFTYLRYSVLTTPEPDMELHGQQGLLQSRPVTIEDWLWHQLSVTIA